MSLETGLHAVSLIGFCLFISQFSDNDQARCARFLFIGLLVNVVTGVIQLSFDRPVAITAEFLPFDMRAGLFANENHLAALIYAAIPLLGWFFLGRGGHYRAYGITVSLLIFFLFALGSRAGMVISTLLGLACGLWFWTGEKGGWRELLVVGGGCLAAIAFLALLPGLGILLEGDPRGTIYATTWRAIGDHWLTGSGLGTFTAIYPQYEAREDIIRVYTNHAHNDLLELFLETGIAGVALICASFALLCRDFRRSRFAEGAFIACMALMIHSLLDYPLRTMSLSIVFAFLATVVLSARRRNERPEAGGGSYLKHNG
jgi:O-antigen ligase